jgi:peptidoglycan/LPS O-acetylase OafA/YrhL
MNPLRVAGWAVVAGLIVAACVAIAALLSGSLDEEGGRFALTSLGFSVFSGVGAPGAELVRRGGDMRALGYLAVGLALAGFVLLIPALWVEDLDDDLWQAWGAVAVLALCAAHASFVLGGRRPTDSPAVRWLGDASIVLSVIDTIALVLTIVGELHNVEESLQRLFAVSLVLLVLSSALPPILRRLGRAQVRSDGLAGELEAIAGRLEALGPAATREATELRRIAERTRG